MIRRLERFTVVLSVAVLLMVSPHARAFATNTLPTWGTVPRGMAGAYVVGRGSLSGITYNPAVSSTLARGKVSSDFSSRQFSSQLAVRQGSLGVLLRRGSTTHSFLGNRSQVNFDFDNFSFSAPSLGLDLSQNIVAYNFGVETLTNLHLGYTLNYLTIQSSVDDGEATGWGADVGLVYEMDAPISIGLSARNVAGSKTWSTGLKQELNTRVRGALRLELSPGLELETGGVHDEKFGVTSLNSGLEWWLYAAPRQTKSAVTESPYRSGPWPDYHSSESAFAVRFGLERDRTSEELNPAFGFTGIVEETSFHYSYHQETEGTGSHSFGLTTGFGGE